MKIKLEREEIPYIKAGNKILKVGVLYLLPDDPHAFVLTKIYQGLGREWMFKIGDRVLNFTEAAKLEEWDLSYLRRCDCSFVCEGYILKTWTWI